MDKLWHDWIEKWLFTIWIYDSYKNELNIKNLVWVIHLWFQYKIFVGLSLVSLFGLDANVFLLQRLLARYKIPTKYYMEKKKSKKKKMTTFTFTINAVVMATNMCFRGKSFFSTNIMLKMFICFSYLTNELHRHYLNWVLSN